MDLTVDLIINVFMDLFMDFTMDLLMDRIMDLLMDHFMDLFMELTMDLFHTIDLSPDLRLILFTLESAIIVMLMEISSHLRTTMTRPMDSHLLEEGSGALLRIPSPSRSRNCTTI